MTRIRTPFVSGTITDNPLTIGATTINSAGLAGLPTIASPNIAVLVLDPTGTGGAPEVVWVTAHTASASTATILRAQEGSIARAHNSGITFIHAPTTYDFVEVYGANIASAGTITLPISDHEKFFNITGTTAITAIVLRPAGSRIYFRFSTSLLIRHNIGSPGILIAGGADITTVADEVIEFVCDGSSKWTMVGRSAPAPAAPPTHDNNANQGGSVSMSTQSTYVDSGSLAIPANGTYLVIATINIANNILGAQHSFTAAIRNQANTVLASKGCAFEGNAAVGANQTLTVITLASLSSGNTIKCSAQCSTAGNASLAVTGHIQYIRMG